MPNVDMSSDVLNRYVNACRDVVDGVDTQALAAFDSSPAGSQLFTAIEKAKPELLARILEKSNGAMGPKMESMLFVRAYEQGLRCDEFEKNLVGTCVAYWDAGDLDRDTLQPQDAVDRMRFELDKMYQLQPEEPLYQFCQRLLNNS